ncbi:NAD(P)H-dependent oxidoreductase [Saccharopolyspora erythraea]|uniref:NAD(P)H-dependent oxidoreductase n=1 Tax=Saccharopolyspora erythraea TaxID=1836 RepID=UPI0024AEEA4B|nr:NAD(P)H-dependent oxidoreductase [Saccharopolyspora erythraea]
MDGPFKPQAEQVRAIGHAALAGKRAMLLLTTGGPNESFRPGGAFGSLSDFLFHIHRGMLEFVGFRSWTPWSPMGPARMTDEERAAALDAVGESVALIAADSKLAV